jgi:hypothetical protein
MHPSQKRYESVTNWQTFVEEMMLFSLNSTGKCIFQQAETIGGVEARSKTKFGVNVIIDMSLM